MRLAQPQQSILLGVSDILFRRQHRHHQFHISSEIEIRLDHPDRLLFISAVHEIPHRLFQLDLRRDAICPEMYVFTDPALFLLFQIRDLLADTVRQRIFVDRLQQKVLNPKPQTFPCIFKAVISGQYKYPQLRHDLQHFFDQLQPCHLTHADIRDQNVRQFLFYNGQGFKAGSSRQHL